MPPGVGTSGPSRRTARERAQHETGQVCLTRPHRAARTSCRARSWASVFLPAVRGGRAVQARGSSPYGWALALGPP